MSRSNEKTRPPAGPQTRTPLELGSLARAERKRQSLSLASVHEATGIGMRFLSEFERGKPNASLGRTMDALRALGLEMLVLPRGEAQKLLALRNRMHHRDSATEDET